MASALAQKTVDAAVIPEPAATAASGTIEKLGDAYGAIAPDFTTSAFIATSDWAGTNDDLAKRFVAAIVETARWANAHAAASAKFLTAASDLDPALAATMTRATFGDTISAPTLAPPLQAAVTYGALAFTASVIGIMAAAQPYWSAVRR
jgi:ABC-type nitrate/sulfonate/bicarbonate transport system substrate-binding protein